MKPYQKERTDLLINTNYGIPKEEISEEEAKRRNLKLFKGRWVTREEWIVLKAEQRAYSGIRTVAVLTVLGVLISSILLFIYPQRYGLNGDIGAAILFTIFLWLTALPLAYGLWTFKRWARWYGNIVAILSLPAFLYTIIALYNLNNAIARQIFSKPKKDA